MVYPHVLHCTVQHPPSTRVVEMLDHVRCKYQHHDNLQGLCRDLFSETCGIELAIDFENFTLSSVQTLFPPGDCESLKSPFLPGLLPLASPSLLMKTIFLQSLLELIQKILSISRFPFVTTSAKPGSPGFTMSALSLAMVPGKF